MIIRGTTPTLTMGLPFGTDLLDIGFLTVQQNNVTVIEKELSNCRCEGQTVSAKFTQEETLKLSTAYPAEINLVVKTLGGERLETERPYIVKVFATSKDGVI